MSKNKKSMQCTVWKLDIIHGKCEWQYQYEQMSCYPTQEQHFLHHPSNLLLTWNHSFANLCSSTHQKRTAISDKVQNLQSTKPAIVATNNGINYQLSRIVLNSSNITGHGKECVSWVLILLVSKLKVKWTSHFSLSKHNKIVLAWGMCCLQPEFGTQPCARP